MPEITIATSIAPRNLAQQRTAVDTWLNLGLNVISINSAEEAFLITEHFPDISIKIVNRTAAAVTGKPYVFFDDLLLALDESGAEICGIVNADIHLRGREDCTDFIAREAAGAFLFVSRIDVNTPAEFAGERYLVGFDLFFFDRNVIDCYPPSGFCLGAPWWDYWAPMVPILKGIPCKEIVSPFAFHPRHETKWAPELYARFGEELATALRPLPATVAAGPALIAGITRVFATKDFNLFSLDILRLILEGAKQIDLYGDVNDRVEISLTEFASNRRQLLERNSDSLLIAQEVARLGTELATLTAAGTAAGTLVHALQNSLSWRITKPFRWLGDWVRQGKE